MKKLNAIGCCIASLLFCCCDNKSSYVSYETFGQLLQEVSGGKLKGEDLEFRMDMLKENDPLAGVIASHIIYPKKIGKSESDSNFVEIQIEILASQQTFSTKDYKLFIDGKEYEPFEVSVEKRFHEGSNPKEFVQGVFCYVIPLDQILSGKNILVKNSEKSSVLMDVAFVSKWTDSVYTKYASGEVSYERSSSYPKWFLPVGE